MKTKIGCLIISVCVLTSLFFSACQDPESSASVDQDRIYVIYELFYNQNTDITKGRATFRFGNAIGTPLFLATGSEVSCDGELMSKFLDAVTIYVVDFAGKKDSATFKWIDTDGKEFFNTVHMTEIDYVDSITAIPNDAAFEFFWDGDALVDGENVVLLIDAVGNASQLFNETKTGSNSIILSKAQLEKLPEGDATLYMDKKHTVDLQEATSAGGTIFSTYRPTNKVVEIQ
ncbi:MAG: hypothetical protein ISR55_06840 [Bacteroidetes bacterium]|nr:hypothetical protein [Bacteroidota bacterium]